MIPAFRCRALPAVRPLRAGFCSAGGPKKPPPKGFEKYYKKPGEQPKNDPSKPAEGAKEQSKSTKDGPKETPKKAKESGKGSKKDSWMPKDLPKTQQWQTAGLIAGAAGLMIGASMGPPLDAPTEISMQELMRDFVAKGLISHIEIVNREFCRAHIRTDAQPDIAGKVLVVNFGAPEVFEARLDHLQAELGLPALDHIPISYSTEASVGIGGFFNVFITFAILVPLVMAARSGMSGPPPGGAGGGRNMFTMGKAFPAGQKSVKSKVKFKDVAGMDQAKKEVVEFVDFLKDPSKYEKLGARIPKGGLLVGPPGTGKTLIAKAVAGEADCPFFAMSGSDFVEMFAGVGASRMRDLFKQAREAAPSIIFIDEIDAVGRKRGGGGFSGGGNDESENTLNQMLVEMDGFSSGAGVVVLAGTNRSDVLDPALTRPGRFDRQINIDKPDLRERAEIFILHLAPVVVNPELDVQEVAKRMAALTPGMAGADIASICNEAAIHAARRKADSVDMVDFERATERVLGGLPKENSMMSAQEKHTVALHESGHAVIGWFLEHADPLIKVSIVPRSGGALGFAQYLPEEMSLYSKEAILDKIAVSLGGRAAEELFVGRISTGASDDLDKVTKMAYAMVSIYGMNKDIGLLSYNNQGGGNQFYKPYSDETGRIMDREARLIVGTQYTRVKELLMEKKDLITAMAKKLGEVETLVYHDIRELLGERPHGFKEEYSKFVTAGKNPFTDGMGGDSRIKSDAAGTSTAPPAEPDDASKKSAPSPA